MFSACLYLAAHPVGTLRYNRNRPGRAIDSNLLPCTDALRCTWHTDHCRDTIFAGDDGTVRHSTAHFHYQTTSGKEERRPTGVGCGSDQHFAWLQSSASWIEDDTCLSRD